MLISRAIKIFSFLWIISLIGCQSVATPASQIQPSSVVKTPEIVLTATLPIFEATPVQTESSTTIPTEVVLPTDSVVQNQCPEISTQFTPGVAKGVLVVSERDGLNTLFNLETGEKESLGGASNPIVSPSRNYLAYVGLDDNTLERFLVVQTIGDSGQSKIPLFNGILRMPGWFDDQRILFRMTSDYTTDPSPHSIVLFNPFTGEKKTYTPNFPGIDHEVEWNFSGPAVYDQTMKYVMYAGYKNTDNKTHEYILWNIASQTKIASLPGSSYNGSYLYDSEIIQRDGVSNNPPRWSPNNDRVAIISSASEHQIDVDEIFSVTIDGKIQQLTYFAGQYKNVTIGKMEWSPNGEKIAFWVTLKPNPYEMVDGAYQDVRLAVLDIETFNITYYCLSGDIIGLANGIPSAKFIGRDIPAPLWSLDSTQIVIENRYTSDNSRLILLDIPSGKSVVLGKDMEPVGWMLGYK